MDRSSFFRGICVALVCVCALAGCGRNDLADAPTTTALAPLTATLTLAPTTGVYPPPPTNPPDWPGYPLPTEQVYPPPAPSATPSPVPAEPAADFAFSLAYGYCNPDIISTFSNSFTRNEVTTPVASVPLQLSAEEMATIYHKMVEINFFAYPAQFRPLKFDGQQSAAVPSFHYEFAVRNNGNTTTVSWSGVEDLPSIPAPEAHRLDALAKVIIDIAQSRPAVAHLPQAPGACV